MRWNLKEAEGKALTRRIEIAYKAVAVGKKANIFKAHLEKFFDRVNHDILMSRIGRKVKDNRVLRLIRRYLQAGIMEGGITTARTEGTPQGGLCKALHNPPYA